MMAVKLKKPRSADAEKNPRNTAQCNAGATDHETWCNIARLATSPELASYRVIGAAEAKTAIGEKLDVPCLLEVLREQSAAVNRGELVQAEAMLMNQATALQSLFVRLAEASFNASMLPQQEISMRLALKAQSQCRATLETLAAIKNPPVVYARQANVTTGPQQINNGQMAPAPAREKAIEPNQLSGDSHELLPDPGTSSFAGGINQEVEALGKVHWTKVPRG